MARAPFAATGLALAALAPLAGTGLAAAPAGAQTRASLDAGVSHVEYVDFLPSAALSLTPAIRVAGERLGFVARATWLQFESGNNSVQGLVAGSLLLPASPDVVAELGAELGGSRYEDFARFSHVLGRARLQFRGARGGGGWIGATVGAAASDAEGRAVQRLAGALLLDQRDLRITLGGAGTFVGSTGYADLDATLRHARPGGFVAEAVVSARAGDPGGDGGPYVEATLTMPLSSHAAIVLAGGRYATDPVRGNIAGRYVTAALRLTAPLSPRPPVTLAIPAGPPADNGATVAAALVEARRVRGDACTLVFRTTHASAIEVMADFTDWLPVALGPAGPDLWSITLPIPPGRHRLNVRVNGGPWGVPAGTTPVADDFQGTVGAVVIP